MSHPRERSYQQLAASGLAAVRIAGISVGESKLHFFPSENVLEGVAMGPQAIATLGGEDRPARQERILRRSRGDEYRRPKRLPHAPVESFPDRHRCPLVGRQILENSP